MKHFFAAAALIALPVLGTAQTTATSETEFQEMAIDTASNAGVAALPAACAGLYRAMWLLSPEGSENADVFNEKHVSAAMVGIELLADENGTDGGVETVNMVGYVDNVSTVFLDWFVFNRANDEFITDMIRGNFTFCEEQLVTWARIRGE